MKRVWGRKLIRISHYIHTAKNVQNANKCLGKLQSHRRPQFITRENREIRIQSRQTASEYPQVERKACVYIHVRATIHDDDLDEQQAFFFFAEYHFPGHRNRLPFG